MFLLTSSTMNSNVSWPAAELGAVGWGGEVSVQQWVIRSEMDSHGEEDFVRTVEALYLEVSPLQKAKLGASLAHRKTFSLDYTNVHREAHYRGQNSPRGYSDMHFPGRDLQAGHMLRSTASQQASTSPCHWTSSPPYSRAVMLSRRSDLEPVRSDIIRGSHISREDQEAGGSFNRRVPLMSLSSSEDEQEAGEQAGRAPAGLSVASSLLTPTPTGERRPGKRERKRLKSLRRRQRRRERCRQSQQQENVQVKQKCNQACIYTLIHAVWAVIRPKLFCQNISSFQLHF